MILSFRIFKTLPISNGRSWGAEILRECSTPTMCHMSCVISHMSQVTCYMSCVPCHFNFFLQSPGVWECQWRVCYHRSLPRLVSSVPPLLFSLLLLFSTNKYTSKTSYQIHVYKLLRKKMACAVLFVCSDFICSVFFF